MINVIDKRNTFVCVGRSTDLDDLISRSEETLKLVIIMFLERAIKVCTNNGMSFYVSRIHVLLSINCFSCGTSLL